MRDIVFGRIQPLAIINPLYLIITTSTAIAIYFLHGILTMPPMAFAGLLTAVGGGILRDVFVNEIPIVFVKELYASASFVGIIIFYFLLDGGVNLNLAAIPSIIAAIIALDCNKV